MKVLVVVVAVAVVLVFVMVEVDVEDADVVLEDVAELEVKLVDVIDAVVIDDELVVIEVKVLVLVDDVRLVAVFVNVEVVFVTAALSSVTFVILAVLVSLESLVSFDVFSNGVSLNVSFDALSIMKELKCLRGCRRRELTSAESSSLDSVIELLDAPDSDSAHARVENLNPTSRSSEAVEERIPVCLHLCHLEVVSSIFLQKSMHIRIHY